jgi:galactokinase/mevalonate kinase-like predicted kinase
MYNLLKCYIRGGKKRNPLNSISNSEIDSYYNLALEAGASGGKLLGAGGGGFILLYCDEQYQKSLDDQYTCCSCRRSYVYGYRLYSNNKGLYTI